MRLRTLALPAAALTALLLCRSGFSEGEDGAGKDAPMSPAPADLLGGPLFEDAAEAAGLQGVAATRDRMADLDSDGYPDLILDAGWIYLNRPKAGGGRTFVRSDKDAFLNEGRKPDIVQIGDVNNDGIPDLYLGRVTDLGNPDFKDDGKRSEIWLGDGKGGWVRKEKSGVEEPPETPLSACFVDLDNDGILDLFVGNAFKHWGRSNEACPNRVYRGRGDGTFEDRTEKAGMLGVAEPGGVASRRPTFGVSHMDWNNDGRQDLLVMTYARQANRLWRNNGDWTFTDVGPETTFDADDIRHGKYDPRVKAAWARQGQRMDDEPEWSSHGNNFDVAVGDVDGDGNLDCFIGTIAHGWAGTSSDPSMMLMNLGKDGGWKFRREPKRIPREKLDANGELDINANWGDQHVSFFDVDNDGRLDLLIASSDYPDEQILKLYHQEGDGSFSDWTERMGFRWQNGIQIALGDYDRDGAVDIVECRWHMRLTPQQQQDWPVKAGLFRNLAPAKAGNRFLSLRLTGGGKAGASANRDAIGARVTVWIGGKRQIREIRGGHGCGASRDDNECCFGVGKAAKVDKIEVRWPDAKNTVQTFTDVDTSRFYTLKQGGKLEPAKP